MAHLDLSRSALTLNDVELMAATLVGGGDASNPALASDEAQEAIAELERAGILVEGRIGGYPARVLAVLADPDIRVLVEKFVAEGPVREFGATYNEYGVWGRAQSNGSNEFTPIEPELIPWEIARSVNLGSRPSHETDSELRVPASTLQGALDLLLDGKVEAADRKLGEGGTLDAGQQRTLLGILLQRRLSWRAFSQWRAEGDTKGFASVAVIDGGEAGYWLSDHEEPMDGSETIARLTATSPSDIWDCIIKLVPAASFAGSPSSAN